MNNRDILLAARLLVREWRAGELRIMLLALVIAVLVSTAISFFTDRLERGMSTRAAEFLGADLRLSSRTPLPDEYLLNIFNFKLQHADVVDFSSVTSSTTEMQLSSIKAVSPGYPLRGELRISDSLLGSEKIADDIPEQGEVWVEGRLLKLLGLEIGQSLEIGYAQLNISAVITHEPDRAGDFYSLTPRVLMNIADLPATQVIQPGSRVRYNLLLSGDANDIDDYRRWVTPLLTDDQQLAAVNDDNRQIGNALNRANQFLSLASITAVVLAGVAVAMSANRFASRHYDTSALLRCLGASRRRTLQLFIAQLLGLGMLATVIGLALGWLMQWGLVNLLRELLPPDLPAAGYQPLIVGTATGLVALIGFALPPLLRLGRVSPLRVLRRELTPMPASAWLIYGVALAGLCLLMWQFTGNLTMTLAVIAGGALAALLFGSLIWALLYASASRLRHASLAWRLGSGQLLKQPGAAAGQVLAFGLILMSMLVIFILRSELLDTWQAQLPADAPNHFALNILPAEEQAFRDKLNEIGAQSAPLYPVTPGRLTAINGIAVRQQVTKDSEGERAISRDLSLTSGADLPADNQLVAGQWWDQLPATTEQRVSIEAELAKSLGVALNDQLSFVIGAEMVDARVSSIRSVNWDNFTPNFYMIFAPGVLDGKPTTLLTSFHLAAGQRDNLRKLTQAFPAMTLLEVDSLLEQLRDILSQVTLAVEYVLVFVLLAGFTVLFASLQSTLDTRLYEGALLRTLGARRQLLRQANRLEFALLGMLAGLLAIVAAELITVLLYHWVLKLPWRPHYLLWLFAPLGGALLVGIAGALGTRAVVKQSPMLLINRGG